MKKLVLIAALLSAGCVAVPVEGNEQAPGAGGATAGCDAGKARSLVGKPHTAAIVDEASRLSGAKAVRVIRPGDVVTMDYREDRLNLRLDGQDRIEGANCG